MNLTAVSIATSHRVAQALAPAKVQAAASSSKSADTGTTVTSSDFLNLLVTEMKNQDPTQPTDPNAYIQQLVGVNSLQQLIAINQELKDNGAATTAGSSQLSLPLGIS